MDKKNKINYKNHIILCYFYMLVMFYRLNIAKLESFYSIVIFMFYVGFKKNEKKLENFFNNTYNKINK